PTRARPGRREATTAGSIPTTSPRWCGSTPTDACASWMATTSRSCRDSASTRVPATPSPPSTFAWTGRCPSCSPRTTATCTATWRRTRPARPSARPTGPRTWRRRSGWWPWPAAASAWCPATTSCSSRAIRPPGAWPGSAERLVAVLGRRLHRQVHGGDGILHRGHAFAGREGAGDRERDHGTLGGGAITDSHSAAAGRTRGLHLRLGGGGPGPVGGGVLAAAPGRGGVDSLPRLLERGPRLHHHRHR